MEKYIVQTCNPAETKQFAKLLASYLVAGDVLTLEGDLGAGKTTFTKGLAAGLGITQVVNSPTFTIIKEYEGDLPLYHMDVYRLEDSDEDLGFDEYFEGEGVTVVEWASFIGDMLPDEFLKITMKYINEQERQLILTPVGKRYVTICEELMK